MLFNVSEHFRLSPNFLEKYHNKQPEWGPVGYITYKRTYARVIEKENRTEEYWETLKRVVEGCYTIQLNHCRNLKLPWNAHKAQKSAQEMYNLMWDFKFLPPGRGLWAMGAPFIYERGSAAMCNCAFTSTNQINTSFSEPFCFLMDMSLIGVGVAFDTLGSELIEIKDPRISECTYSIEDSREGWVDIVRTILDAYSGYGSIPKNIDYSLIRPSGSPIRTFGGIAPGPDPLIRCVDELRKLLDSRVGEKIRSTDIVDLMNIIGKAVVAGGIRRTAELALGDSDDEEYMMLKDTEKNGELLKKWRWASNNSISCKIGMDYTKHAKQTSVNGEPGYFWLENARKYGRLKDGENWVDERVMGCNPCGEQSLEDREECNLVETFPSRHNTPQEYKKTLKYSYLYAKTVTLVPTHNEITNQIMLRNRRIGLSMSGIVEAFEKFGKREFLNNWCDEGYEYVSELDKKYSRWFCIPESIKKTTIKPSGTVSLLPGVSPGMHYPHSKYYLRAIRIDKSSTVLESCKKSGYQMEESVYGDNTIVVYFPVKSKNYDRSKGDVSIWEQVENAAAMQYYWSDNQVSVTVTFDKEESKDIPRILELYESRLKSISFLPYGNNHKYEQPPYQEISEEEYNTYIQKLKPLEFNKINTKEVEDKYCDGDNCVVDFQDKL